MYEVGFGLYAEEWWNNVGFVRRMLYMADVLWQQNRIRMCSRELCQRILAKYRLIFSDQSVEEGI